MADPFAALTPVARAVLVRADAAARRLHAGQIDAIHLLLGLLAEPGSAAGQALADLRLTPAAARAGARAALSPPAGGPDLTPGARAALRTAIVAARHYRHRRIGTLHLLAGVLAEPSPAVAQALRQAALSAPAARAAVAILLAGPADWLGAECPTLHRD